MKGCKKGKDCKYLHLAICFASKRCLFKITMQKNAPKMHTSLPSKQAEDCTIGWQTTTAGSPQYRRTQPWNKQRADNRRAPHSPGFSTSWHIRCYSHFFSATDATDVTNITISNAPIKSSSLATEHGTENFKRGTHCQALQDNYTQHRGPLNTWIQGKHKIAHIISTN